MNLLKKFQLIGLCLCLINSPLIYASTEDHHAAVAALKEEIDHIANEAPLDAAPKEQTATFPLKGATSTNPNMASLKQTYRSNLNAVAAGGKAMGYDLSCQLLLHGLEENPCDLTYGVNSPAALKLRTSNCYMDMIQHFKSQLNALPPKETVYLETGSLALSDDTDLYLSLNKISYQVAGEKMNNTWTIYVKISDTYDFNYWEMPLESVKASKFAIVLNNYGYKAQLAGAISPYHIVLYDEFN